MVRTKLALRIVLLPQRARLEQLFTGEWERAALRRLDELEGVQGSAA